MCYGPASWEAPQLAEAVLRRWLVAQPGPSAAGSGIRDEDFAAQVLRAARGSRSGRVGARRVFVSHVWRQLARDGMALPLDDLKRRLLAAHRSGQLVLSKADMPQLLDVQDVESSRIVHRSTEFVFVEV